jgi:hypothetical protein
MPSTRLNSPHPTSIQPTNALPLIAQRQLVDRRQRIQRPITTANQVPAWNRPSASVLSSSPPTVVLGYSLFRVTRWSSLPWGSSLSPPSGPQRSRARLRLGRSGTAGKACSDRGMKRRARVPGSGPAFGSARVRRRSLGKTVFSVPATSSGHLSERSSCRFDHLAPPASGRNSTLKPRTGRTPVVSPNATLRKINHRNRVVVRGRRTDGTLHDQLRVR